MRVYILDETLLPFVKRIKINEGDYIFTCKESSICVFSVIDSKLPLDTNNGSIAFLYSTNCNPLKFEDYKKEKEIFKFDGSTRKGNIDILVLLKEAFNIKSVRNFIDNAINICSFRLDEWENGVLENLTNRNIPIDDDTYLEDEDLIIQKVRLCHPEVVKVKAKKTKTKKPVHQKILSSKSPAENKDLTPLDYLFYDFLSKDCQLLWENEATKNTPIDKIFDRIRKYDIDKYLKALSLFHAIYSNDCSVFSTIEKKIYLRSASLTKKKK